MVFNSTRCVFFCNEVKDRKIFQIASPENRKPLKKTKKETISCETASQSTILLVGVITSCRPFRRLALPEPVLFQVCRQVRTRS